MLVCLCESIFGTYLSVCECFQVLVFTFSIVLKNTNDCE